MKVFISHQQADSELAGQISYYFKMYHQIDCYLDLIDPNASKAGDQLGDYLREVMGKCTQLMAVVSENTKCSSSRLKIDGLAIIPFFGSN